MPFPASLFLLALGSFVAQGEFDAWNVMLLAIAASIIGDIVGYAVGRIGGRAALDAIARRTGWVDQIKRAEAFAVRWDAPGIFLSRWLITGLGPSINLTSGVANYPLGKFLFWDALGETVWVGLYVSLGRIFHDRIEDLESLISSVAWFLVALVVALVSGWVLVWQIRHAAERGEAQAE